MVMAESDVPAAADVAGCRSRSEVAAVYRRALVCAGHPEETIRVLAGGTMAAASWALGSTDRAPRTHRRIRGPSVADLRVEYLAALEGRSSAPDRIAYANDTGVVDVLGFLVDPEQDPPWWQCSPEDAAAGA
jgi:hypothetical protein